MVELKKFLIERKDKGEKIFPPGKYIFRAFEKTPFDAVKVVILGQDPYHGPGQANGLAFSVSREVPLPPSLKNILKEIRIILSFFFIHFNNLTFQGHLTQDLRVNLEWAQEEM